MEEDRVENTCHNLIHLSSFHGQLEGDTARVHGAGAAPSVARRETARRHWHNRTPEPAYTLTPVFREESRATTVLYTAIALKYVAGQVPYWNEKYPL